MMRAVRTGLRITAVVLWCGLGVLVGSVGGFLGRFELAWKTTTGMVWSRVIARILRMHITVAGTPPRGRFLLVSNHLGYMDIVLILTQVRAIFVGRADLDEWPMVKWLIRPSGMILIDRSRRSDIRQVNARISDVLRRGGSLALFPEATTSPGDRVYPFRSALLDYAARYELEVKSAALSYRTPPGEAPANEAVVWFGDMPFSTHVKNLAAIPSFEATIAFAEKPVAHRDRKVLARMLTETVQAHFTPVGPEDAEAGPAGPLD